jgi:hypothetical protein
MTRHLLFTFSLAALLAAPTIALANPGDKHHDNTWQGDRSHYAVHDDRNRNRDDRYHDRDDRYQDHGDRYQNRDDRDNRDTRDRHHSRDDRNHDEYR